MALSDLAKSAAKTKPAEPVAAAPTNALAIAPAIGSNAILAAVAAAEDGTGPSFPILFVTGGSAGGMFTPLEGTPQEIVNKLPQGKQSVDGVFMGFRTEMSAWPVGYDDRDPAAEGRPAWAVAVPGADEKGTLLILNAAKKYQFTPRSNKAVWDTAASGVGHIRPVLQLLVWHKGLQDLIVVQSPASFDSWLDGLRTLGRLQDPVTHDLGQFPLSIRITSQTKTSKGGFTWPTHSFAIDVPPNAASVEMLNAAKAWRAGLSDERVEQVTDWLSGADKPLTDDIASVLVKAKSIG